MRIKPPEELLNLAKSLFEANEDLTLALVGGLAAQEIYALRRIRSTSDIDIATKREYVDVFLERSKKIGYETFYNENLDKYSVFKHEEGIHIDIYPDKIERYSFDINFWKKCKEIDSFTVVSPEDLIAIKIYSYLKTKKGSRKHMIDIYSIIIGKEEIDLNYLENRIEKIAEILDMPLSKLFSCFNLRSEDAKRVLEQFSSKEVRFLKEEIKRILNYFNSNKDEKVFVVNR